MRLKLGDIVQLKSGGPKMTIISADVDGGGRLVATWFAGSKNERGYFPPDALDLVDEAKAK